VHYFRDVGYRHTTIQHCPANAPLKQSKREPWLEENIKDPRKRKQDDDFWEKWDKEMTNGVGCHCRCDTDIPEVEIKEGSCMPEWFNTVGGYLD
jgi:mannosyltransferase